MLEIGGICNQKLFIYKHLRKSDIKILIGHVCPIFKFLGNLLLEGSLVQRELVHFAQQSTRINLRYAARHGDISFGAA